MILHNLCSVKHRLKKKPALHTLPSFWKIIDALNICYYQVISNPFMNFTGQGSSGKNKLLQGNQLKVRQFYWESEHINIFERRQGKSGISCKHDVIHFVLALLMMKDGDTFQFATSMYTRKLFLLLISDQHIFSFVSFVSFVFFVSFVSFKFKFFVNEIIQFIFLGFNKQK